MNPRQGGVFRVRRLLRYLALPFLLGVGIMACFAGWFVGMISRHPEAFLGGKPVGAVKVVRAFADSVRWLTGKVKKYLLSYLRSNHSLVFRKVRKILDP